MLRIATLFPTLVLLTAMVGCSTPPAESQPRSPSRDYPPPPAENSNGEIIGADRQSPSDKLMTGPRVGSMGVAPAAGAVIPNERHPAGSPSSVVPTPPAR